MGRMWASGLMVPAVLVAGSVETLCEAALRQELPLQRLELAVEEVVGLVDQANHGVGGGFGWGLFDVGPIGLIGLMGPIGDPSDRLGLGVVFGPGGESALAEEILAVLEQLFQAGAGYAGEFELGLLRCGGGLARSDAVRRYLTA